MTRRGFSKVIVIASIFLPLLMGTAWADAEQDIQFILNAKNPPKGVVFEVVEGKDDALRWALPEINRYSKQLRQKIPHIKIAVVSHGAEQFGLLKDNQSSLPEVHKTVQSLVQSDTPVHICGTHASWRDKDKKDFPEYVDVVPAGPAKIRQYQRDGYALVIIGD